MEGLLSRPELYGADDALVAQLDEGVDATGGRLLPVVVGIMQVRDVEVIGPDALERLLHRTQDAVAAEVPDARAVCWNDEAIVVEAVGRLGALDQQPSHLGRKQDVGPISATQRTAQPSL